MYVYIHTTLYMFLFFPFVSCSLQMSDVLTKQRLLQNRLKCLKQDANDVENKQTNQDMFLYHSFFIVLCLMFCFVLLCFAFFCFGTFTTFQSLRLHLALACDLYLDVVHIHIEKTSVKRNVLRVLLQR